MSDLSITIVLPAYNEEQTIAETIKSFHEFVPDAEYLVVDNNSTDCTSEVAKYTIENLGIAKGRVIRELRQGKGFAMRRAFMEVQTDIVVMSDADLTYPANQVKELIAPIASGEYDIVVGDRLSNKTYLKENKRRFHSLGNATVAWLINTMFRADLSDIMSGYRAFSRRFVKTYPVLSGGFEIETEMTLHTLDKRLALKEVPIKYVDRPEGSFSKLNTFSDGLKVIYAIFQILRYYKPLIFFTVFTIIFFILGLISGVPVILEFIETGVVLKVPRAILATGFMVLSGLMLTIGLVLSSISHLHRFDFEIILLSDKNRN